MTQSRWEFQGNEGVFKLKDPEKNSYLYFPLVNEAGMMSAITPNLHGSMTSGHNTFLMEPVSAGDLHNSKASRNFWIHIKGHGAWSVCGNSAKQNASQFEEDRERSEMEGGFLWHKLIRHHAAIGLKAETTSFVPVTDDKVELMKVTLTNTGSAALDLTPTSAIPLYGRSADDLRDHRHVTSLLHRIYVSDFGVEVQPALSFDERGHRINKVSYSVLGAEGSGKAPIGMFPVQEEFTGEGGALDWPEAVVCNREPQAAAGISFEGYEAVGALRFAPVQLLPGQSASYIMAMIISEGRINDAEYAQNYLSAVQFEKLLKENEAYWRKKLGTIQFRSGNTEQDLWRKWVTLQPILRRLYGNSFLPYHDYGRGGRGWRDLWQDCLALMVMEPNEVRHLLINNYAGVRIDGSNATIIGSQPGEFIADRNNIPRVWMDHGAWPLLTTLLYVHQSGDLDILLQPQSYFRDIFVKRCQERDLSWNADSGNKLTTHDGSVYEGSILEHILLQNIVPFYHVGEHNNIKLEGADWNDGLDLAPNRGESVAFTAFYASNLLELTELLIALQQKSGLETMELAEEMTMLLDSIMEPVDYENVDVKLNLLCRYYDAVTPSVSGNKRKLKISEVVDDLRGKARWMISHLRHNEWITSSEGYAWFNGYYNDDAERVEGEFPQGVRMTLTGQVFSIMGGIATDEQVGKIVQAADRYLKDEKIGYRLNSDFGGVQQNLGRAFGFAFGHKENGAMFSHMTVMYANALYKRGFVKEGYKVLDSIYRLSTHFELSRMYPGIPEYINEKGRGMYTFLTGSASWLLLTELSEVYGVKGSYGDLHLEPKLVKEQFDGQGEAAVETLFADRMLHITYRNLQFLEYGQYRIGSITVNRSDVEIVPFGSGCLIQRSLLEALFEKREGGTERIDIILVEK